MAMVEMTHFMKRSSRCVTRYSLGEKVWSHAAMVAKQFTEKQMEARFWRLASCLQNYNSGNLSELPITH